ncbi:MAG: hypothetical protein JW754_06200 [Candidatus Aenigmarchaeota archaeon]|nr:hypothetical protein [Candidatus Aenigmarchaeota archaeon]
MDARRILVDPKRVVMIRKAERHLKSVDTCFSCGQETDSDITSLDPENGEGQRFCSWECMDKSNPGCSSC